MPGEFLGQRSLAGYSPWGHKELDTTEQLTHNTAVGNSVAISPEIKNITAIRLNNPAKYLSNGIKIRILKSYLHSHAHWSTIHSNQGVWKQLKCPLTGECIKKMCYIHTVKDYAFPP